MPKVSHIQNSFNAGELSPKVRGRFDLKKYVAGCSILENAIPQVHGPAKKRAGTRYVAEGKDSTKIARLMPFEYNVEQAYILEWGELYLRFFANGGVVLSGMSPYEIATPFANTEVNDIDYAQSADVVYLAHPSHPPQKLSRTGPTAWTIEAIPFDWYPFDNENDTTTTITASAATGAGITLTASTAIFAATMVGERIKFSEVIASKYETWATGVVIAIGNYRRYGDNLYRATSAGTTGTIAPIHTSGNESDGTVSWDYVHDGAGYVEIVGYTSGTVVTADVVKELPQTSLAGTVRWSRDAWSEANGYPRCVTFYEDRLWFAGSAAKPQTIWASVVGDYENHKGGVDADDALQYTINARDVNVIEWMSPGRVLSIGTTSSEFTMSASSIHEAVTPTNVRIVPQTYYGSHDTVRPVRTANVVLFLQRAGKKVREYVYNFDADAYVAPNLTVLAEHVTGEGIVDMSYHQEPDQVVWAPREDGQLTGLTYERAEEVVGWHRHPLGGDGAVTSVATIPHWDGGQDSTWLLVTRTINGATVQFIEYIEKYLTGTDALFMDAALTYDGAAATVIAGLDHLEGETLAVLADGAVHPPLTVASGQVTLQSEASVASFGLPYSAKVRTMPIEAGAADGVAQGKIQRCDELVLRLHETGPGVYYGDGVNMDEYHPRSTEDLMDAPVPLETGDTDVLSFPGENARGLEIQVEHRLPTPFTLVALMPQLTTYDR